MQLDQKFLDAATVLAGLSPQDAMALQFEARNQQLQAAEDAKDHPLRSPASTDPGTTATVTADPAKPVMAPEKAGLLSDDDWQKLCDHLGDGGGALNVQDLRKAALQAFISRDQPAFFAALVDWFKSDLRVNGNVQPLPNGGVFRAGVA